MSVTWNKGYPAPAGGKVLLTGYVTGPTSYSGGASGGQALYAKQLRSLDWVGAGFTVSGNYFVRAQPKSAGNPTQWLLRWFTGPNSTEVGGGTNLSAEKVNILIVGG